jgi:hypothetical protein
MSFIRDNLVERLKADLLGPFLKDEVLPNKPSDIYLTGILWPSRSQIPLLEDDGVASESEDDDIAPGLSIAGQQRPSVMGVSFATSSNNLCSEIEVAYSFGTYISILTESENGKVRNWRRVDHEVRIRIETRHNLNQFIPLNDPELPQGLDVACHVRVIDTGKIFLTTVTFLNRTSLIDEDFIRQEELTIFQPKIRIFLPESITFQSLPDLRSPLDEDEESTRLLYRNSTNFAFGHQCSASWDITSEVPEFVETDWIPTSNVPNFKQEGHPVFNNLVTSGKLSAKKLATSGSSEIFQTLDDLASAYQSWIDIQVQESTKLNPKFASISTINLSKCIEVQKRIESGVMFLKTDSKALDSFRHANMAMHMQHNWKTTLQSSNSELKWRPFQIAFILLTLESICDGKNSYRETLDLLWFPTGGGKTEAYLALIAMGSWYRRLTQRAELGGGNFAVMRYTLRLLTSQQFERASAVILACEVIRKSLTNSVQNQRSNIPEFSIGLWVGSDATPNNYDDAFTNRGNDYLASPEQISSCYACGDKLSWIYDSTDRIVRPTCSTKKCILGSEFGTWPVMTIDDDIFQSLPTVLIGTVDKFAQVPLKTQTSNVFGFRSNLGTELIIQDELHLISGPLGTIVGIYEVAFDWLLTRNGVRPKIIGSTATIRRASSQVRALFDRESCQFPPSGLEFDDSGFAIVDSESPGRTYVGVSTAGRSAKFSLQAAAGSLLQSGNPLNSKSIVDIDGYTTLLMYFNALRELGGAIVQVLDDVPDSMALYSGMRNESVRIIDAPKELTSRVSQREIVSILNDLSKPAGTDEAVDVVLATNMVSVGVDVPRLGLMLVNGQPKTRAEYIQSTSRVGRSSYPGLVVCLYNAMKARDRSHFETFASLHQSLYRDVEATSVTPFASRSRDRALRAVLIAMIRHSDPTQKNAPDFRRLDITNLKSIIQEIERRVQRIDPSVAEQVSSEIDEALYEWSSRDVRNYLDSSIKGLRTSLLQYAEDYARRVASGNFGGSAWPVMNTMRSVEASTPFRLKEKIFRNLTSNTNTSQNPEVTQQFPWRRSNDTQ